MSNREDKEISEDSDGVTDIRLVISRRVWKTSTCNCEDNKNLPPFCTGTGKSIWVSKIAVHNEACQVLDISNLWHKGEFSSPCKVVGDYFSPSTFNPHIKPPFLLSITTSKHFQIRKGHKLGSILMSQGVHSSKALFPKADKDNYGKTALWIRPEIHDKFCLRWKKKRWYLFLFYK